MLPKLGLNKKIQNNYKHYDNLVTRALLSDTEDRQIYFARKAAEFAATNPCGVFSSPELEGLLCQIAQNHPCLLTSDPKKNSVLHVMTTGYKTGGHTRVVEKWAKHRPEKTHHDVLFIDQHADDTPDFLYDSLESEGLKCLHLKGLTPLEKGLELRKLAMNYEQVVLHTHMHDPVPLLAFGTEDFLRPVIYYNHADHIFWLGVSIADIVVDLTPEGERFSQTRRGVQESTVLPVPITTEGADTPCDKTAARKTLHLPQSKRIMLSIGGSWRYAPVGELNFPEYCTELLKKYDDLVIVIVGVEPNDRHWGRAVKAYDASRLKLVGRVFDKAKYQKYIDAADFYVEALPAGAEITSLEVGLQQLPVFILKKLAIRSEVFESVYFPHYGELKDSIEIYLNEGILLNSQKKFRKQILKVHSEEAFAAGLARIHKQAPKKHRVNTSFTSPYVVTSYDRYLYNALKGMHKARGLTRLLKKAYKLHIRLKDFTRVRDTN
tara:strand:- start:45702 stop:47177 length:1476 start_codon:yes stop_codon:yes gene_type:complete